MGLDDAKSKAAIREWIEQQYEELDRKSYYQLLGVPRDASDRELTTAYYHMVARFHPDLYGDKLLAEDVRAKLVTLYSRLVEGHRVLGDPAKRAQYGRLLDRGKMRFRPEDERAPRRDAEEDIQNPHARRFFKLGRTALTAGDPRAAVMHLKLALSVEPRSEIILAELARAEAQLAAKGGA
jgi:curved DNA-binding protein CbpA